MLSVSMTTESRIVFLGAGNSRGTTLSSTASVFHLHLEEKEWESEKRWVLVAAPALQVGQVTSFL